MLSLGLVLFVATSALAAPSVLINQANINEIAPLPDNGALVNSALVDRAFELVDGGNTNVYTLTIQQILKDLARQPDSLSQALAVGTTIVTLGELGLGASPGDACEYASLANAYASGSGVGSALSSWANRVYSNIDTIVQLANNPNGLRYANGPSSNCAGGGRSYQFEAAWDKILNSANAYQIGLINEEYCAAKRLYSAHTGRSNIIGAAATSVATGPANAALQQALPQLANFLRVAGNGGNPAGAASTAKQALASAVANVLASGNY